MSASIERRLDALTSLKFFAAFAIVIHHSGYFLPPDILTGWPLDHGVSFFFVLSGFILVHVYPELPPAQSVRAFFIARAARFGPRICFVALMLALVGTENVYGDFFAVIANLLLLQGWVPIKDVFFSLNDLSWTVSTELGFYVLFPLLIYRFENTWWWKLLGSVCLLSLLIVICTVFNIPGFNPNYNGVTNFGLLYINPLGRLFEFVLGMSTALAWRRFRPTTGNHIAFWTVIELASILLVLWNARYLTWLAIFHVRSTPFPVTEEWIIHAGSCLSVAFLVFCFASGTGLIGRFLCLSPMVFLGDISYAMYLLHQVLIRGYLVNMKWAHSAPMTIKFPIFLGALLISSTAVYLWVEQPARRWISCGLVHPFQRRLQLRSALVPTPTLAPIQAAAYEFVVAGAAGRTPTHRARPRSTSYSTCGENRVPANCAIDPNFDLRGRFARE